MTRIPRAGHSEQTGKQTGKQTAAARAGKPTPGGADPAGADSGTGGDLTKADYQRLAEVRHALRRLARYTELESRRLGMSPQQYLLLLAIKGYPGRDKANITELAERLQVRHNAVIGLVNRAEENGLVRREPDPQGLDRRVVYVLLTPKGEHLLQVMAGALRGERARVAEALVSVHGTES